MSQDREHPETTEEARELIVGMIEQRLSAAEMARLEELAMADAGVRRLWAIYIHQRVVIETVARAGQQTAAQGVAESMHETIGTPALADEAEEKGPAPLRIPLMKPAAPARETERPRGMERFRAWAAIVVVGIMGVVVMVVNHARQVGKGPAALPVETGSSLPITRPVFVATLDRAVLAGWKGISPNVGDGVVADTRLELTSGDVEFRFDNGSTMVVEAPARLTVESGKWVTLDSGKLSAAVSAAGVGFTVSTRDSRITDLGTQFGVATGADGGTEVDVFKGRVTAQATLSTTRPVVVAQGEAASIANGVSLDPRGAMPQKFVRRLQTDAKTVDLLDLICGGDGTEHGRGGAVDPLSGAAGRLPGRGNVVGDGGYHRIGMPVLDGCFVPDGMTTIDATGRRYDFGSNTGMTFDCIRAGGTIQWLVGEDKPPFSPVLGGVDYSGAGHGLLLMHANSGLTIDLAAVGRLYPGRRLTALRAVLGNTATVDHLGHPVNIRANAYILVDGVARLRRQFSNGDAAIDVNVTIEPGDRYLTLATTQGERNISLAWVIFGDPRFELD